jgi:2-keto-3-deoxy-L-rhamnonate aldolase RhmA
MAREIVSSCRYRGGSRGFSSSPRAGRYGETSMARHVQDSDAHVAVIAMIEDPAALDEIEAIAAVEGLDGVFVGRADLAVALGANEVTDLAIQTAAELIVRAARNAGKPACMMVSGASEGQTWRAKGVSAFVVSSDQGFLRQAALRAHDEFSTLR